MRFAGKIAYAVEAETSPGIFENHITEESIKGTIIRDTLSNQENGQINDDCKFSSNYTFVCSKEILQNINNLEYLIDSRYPIKLNIKNIKMESKNTLNVLVGGVY